MLVSCPPPASTEVGCMECYYWVLNNYAHAQYAKKTLATVTCSDLAEMLLGINVSASLGPFFVPWTIKIKDNEIIIITAHPRAVVLIYATGNKQSITSGLNSTANPSPLNSIISLYSIHIELAHIRIWITLDRNEIWAQDLYHSTALIESAKNLAPSNVKHGKVPETSVGVYGAWRIAQCEVPTQCKQKYRSAHWLTRN